MNLHAYEVTSSRIPGVVVGQCLIDYGPDDAVRSWSIYDRAMGRFSGGFTAKRRETLCHDCYVRGHGALADHDGGHGRQAPKYDPEWLRPKCAQCDSTAPLTDSEHGPLCDVCAFRQAEHDDRRDSFGHLSASSFGFLSEDE